MKDTGDCADDPVNGHGPATGYTPALAKQTVHISAFVGRPTIEANGNPCQLYVYPRAPVTINTAEQSTIECHSWPNEAQANTVVVSCYNHQQPIQCCGHGLLAAASWWLQTGESTSLTLLMNNSDVLARNDGGLTWLTFKRLPTRRCDIPAWLNTLSGNSVAIAAAEAGDDSGYLIIQWPNNYPIEHLPSPGNELGRYTRRALIYTTEQDLQPDANIHYRYFAPQYGIAEDSATGSAMRVLADYWASRFTTLTALQCSSAKGYLVSRASDDTVDVGGYCAYPDKENNSEQ